MTQALNLANFANNLNTSGATSNAGLQNSSVTVTAGTGMSGGGAVALGSSVTLTNAGVTSVTGAGTVTVSASTGAVTITGGGGTGTVTSVATGNGLQGGTITTSGTLSVAAPSSNTVGCYSPVCSGSNSWQGAGTTYTYGSNYSVGNGQNQIRLSDNGGGNNSTTLISGTWRWMACTVGVNGCSTVAAGLGCRVS